MASSQQDLADIASLMAVLDAFPMAPSIASSGSSSSSSSASSSSSSSSSNAGVGGGTTPSKRARKDSDQDVEQPSAKKSRLASDFDWFTEQVKCPVCLDVLGSPIVECKNGHLACAACSRKQERKNECSVCREQVGQPRSQHTILRMIDERVKRCACGLHMDRLDKDVVQAHDEKCRAGRLVTCFDCREKIAIGVLPRHWNECGRFKRLPDRATTITDKVPADPGDETDPSFYTHEYITQWNEQLLMLTIGRQTLNGSLVISATFVQTDFKNSAPQRVFLRFKCGSAQLYVPFIEYGEATEVWLTQKSCRAMTKIGYNSISKDPITRESPLPFKAEFQLEEQKLG